MNYSNETDNKITIKFIKWKEILSNLLIPQITI